MKKNICYIFLLSVLLFACKKDDDFAYNSPDNIYLNYFDEDGVLDTLPVTYSFASSPGLSRDTVWIPVTISGKRASKDRKFVLTEVDSTSTAVKDLHYEALKPYYIMPADSGSIKVPVIIRNIDPELANKSVALTIRIVGNEDFGQGLPIRLRTKTIFYSNRLEQPSWWIYWQGNLGPYSRVTHQLFLISGGQDLVNPGAPNGYLQIPRTLYYLENLRQFVKDPFTWVSRNPAKGYVLTKRTDGTNDYDFYNTSSPEIKFYVKYFPQVNGYFFINEAGSQIVM
ncbi:DUF4843 domain-containing protein [Pedobacter metabolipauper]|uniref:Uncharacterized protein DUF4843 n=1 Tax=Pedobacter metabolipauper TaxID=425513 RepID=A0A4R6SU15_9SPHI|nr:DUF4843 domain-containing protein [Pedobacter metabolipauper]TDQ07126.1 uncharacterized protein DUF4843 [Pedobacter metabolipauper]